MMSVLAQVKLHPKKFENEGYSLKTLILFVHTAPKEFTALIFD